ncbi:MAG: HEAT repeat domain-containing protein [Candidatus Eisenbacteria bacterium]
MNECSRCQALIERYQCGEIAPDELIALEGHTRSCPDCRALMQAHDQLMELGDSVPEPTAAELSLMRGRVLAQIDSEAPGLGPSSFWNDLRAFLGAHPIAVAPAAVVVLMAAVLFGRWTASPTGAGGDTLMAELRDQAGRRLDAGEYLDNPLTYNNVSIRPRGDRFALSFDVSRHVEFEADSRSPVVRDVLLATIVEAPLSGQRLRAIQLTPSIADDRLREALVFTLRNDPDLAVRIEALDALGRYPDAPEVREAMLQILGSDPAVQVRFLALDYLSSRNIDPGLLRQAIDTRPLDGDAALRQRTFQMERRQS